MVGRNNFVINSPMMVKGSMNQRNAERHPPIPAIRVVTWAPIRYDADAPATSHPIAVGLISIEKYSATSVEVIGPTVEMAIPERE
jgi:hypothetical protein